jgi:hypothetical protein
MIEEKIQKLIEALEANTAALRALPQVNVTTTTKPIELIEPKPADDTMAKIEKLKTAKHIKPISPIPTPMPEPPPPAPAPAPAISVTLESLTELALKVVTLGPDAARGIKALNEKHGIERISKCPPDKFQAVWDSLVQLRTDLGGVA